MLEPLATVVKSIVSLPRLPDTTELVMDQQLRCCRCPDRNNRSTNCCATHIDGVVTTIAVTKPPLMVPLMWMVSPHREKWRQRTAVNGGVAQSCVVEINAVSTKTAIEMRTGALRAK